MSIFKLFQDFQNFKGYCRFFHKNYSDLALISTSLYLFETFRCNNKVSHFFICYKFGLQLIKITIMEVYVIYRLMQDVQGWISLGFLLSN
jgi:hypothetical protein